MQKQKLFLTITTVIFITVFSIYNFEIYYNFHVNKINSITQKTELKNNILNFDPQKIKQISNIELHTTPSKDTLEKLLLLIESSKDQILIEMYIFTEKKILQALIKAKQRGVKIKVLLEKSPYKANNINNKTYNTLKENNINVSWSNSDNYSYNHSKLIIIDETFIISTGNLSYSSFTKNKDFYIFVKNNGLLKLIKNNYLNDYNGITNYQYSDKIIYSPLGTRIKFQKLLESAKQEIKIYFPYINDDIFLQQLIKISKEKNINIQIILDKKEKTNGNIIKLKNNGIKIFFFNKYKNHSKAILIDEEFLYIGSINCSKYSIEKNKEIGIIIKNKTIINQFKDIFINDTKKEK